MNFNEAAEGSAHFAKEVETVKNKLSALLGFNIALLNDMEAGKKHYKLECIEASYADKIAYHAEPHICIKGTFPIIGRFLTGTKSYYFFESDGNWLVSTSLKGERVSIEAEKIKKSIYRAISHADMDMSIIRAQSRQSHTPK